jgi:hypothetical protein
MLKDSRHFLAEIDLRTGILKPDFLLIQKSFPRRIRIRENRIYYMAKQKDMTGYTVYSQTFPVSQSR